MIKNYLLFIFDLDEYYSGDIRMILKMEINIKFIVIKKVDYRKKRF